MTFAELERAIEKLKPEVRESGHRILSVKCCGILLGRSKVSRKKGSGKDVGATILSAIPGQLNVTSALWREIAGCTKARPEYLEYFGHKGHP
jgi:hypothetical protein